jgi:hypothetical protein
MIKFIFLVLTILIFSSCDSSSTKAKSYSTNQIGYLVDANVSGVEYYCDDLNGLTASDGSFIFNYSCDDIAFKIGSITLATMKISNVKDDHIFYITDITQRSSRADTNNTAVKNISRLLQTLDDDSNPENGINITQSVRDNITNNLSYEIQSTNISETDLENIIKDANLTKELVSPIRALVHVEQILRDHNISADTVPPYIPYVDNEILATNNDITTINLNGEKNTKIYLDGIYTNKTLSSEGKYKNFELNTSHDKNTFRSFNITLVDDTNKMSKALVLNMFKDTDDLGNKDTFPPSDITINSSTNIVYNDLNITDNSTDYNLSLVYTISGKDKDLFDINSTTLYFKSNPLPNTYYINLTISDLANHQISKDINITVN